MRLNVDTPLAAEIADCVPDRVGVDQVLGRRYTRCQQGGSECRHARTCSDMPMVERLLLTSLRVGFADNAQDEGRLPGQQARTLRCGLTAI